MAPEPLIDDQVTTLHEALDPQRMARVMAPLLGENIVGVEVEMMRRRCKRCVLRYRVQTDRTTHNVIGKVFGPEPGERVFANMRELWALGFARDSADGISMPEPLAFVPDIRLLLQEEIPGVPVKTLVRQGPTRRDIVPFARTLAKLHACSIVPRRPLGVRQQLLRCHPKHPFLAEACPELAESIDMIVSQAHRIEASLDDVHPTLLHGDFHLGQVHIQDDRAWLIDFDALAYGDPASDMGNLIVFLKEKARRRPELRSFIDLFLEEYFSKSDAAVAARIPLYEALTHLRRACKSLRFQNPDWRQRATRMIESGVASIEEMRSRCCYWAEGLRELAVGQRVKVKVNHHASLGLMALEISPKSPAETIGIEAVVHSIGPDRRSWEMLGRRIRGKLPVEVEVGTMVRADGRITPEGQFEASSVSPRQTLSFNIEKLHGPIEAFDREARRLRVLGFDLALSHLTTVEKLRGT